MTSRPLARSLALLLGTFASLVVGQTLPPNHPPIDPAPQAATHPALPADHPPMGAVQGGGPTQSPGLPPNHPPMGATRSQAAAPSAAELLRKLDETPTLKDSAKTFELAVAIAKLYHSNGRFPEAAEYHRQAWEIGKPVRSAYAKVRTQKADPSSCQQKLVVEKLDGQLAALKPEQRPACLHQWMVEVMEAAELQAEALFLSGDAQGALKVLDQALTEAPRSPDALFSRGSILLESRSDEVAALQKARSDLTTLIEAAPGHERAVRAKQLLPRVEKLIAAGGATRLAAQQAQARTQVRASAPGTMASAPPGGTAPGMPALSQETIDAFGKVARTPELEQRLAKLVEDGEAQLAKGQFEAALNQYRQVMPLDPNNGRVRAGLAWAMVGLQKPAADRIWMVAVQSDPAAVDRLGQTLKQQGDARGAKALWTRLAASAPEYAQKSGLSARLQ